MKQVGYSKRINIHKMIFNQLTHVMVVFLLSFFGKRPHLVLWAGKRKSLFCLVDIVEICRAWGGLCSDGCRLHVAGTPYVALYVAVWYWHLGWNKRYRWCLIIKHTFRRITLANYWLVTLPNNQTESNPFGNERILWKLYNYKIHLHF